MLSEEETIKECEELIKEINSHKDKDFIGRLYYKNRPVEELLKGLLDLYKQEKEKNKELEEKCKEVVCVPEGTCFLLKPKDVISKDKIKAIQGQLIMQLGSYVRDEASPEQERIAGGINIINKILKGE